ncbi:hypothetical protein M6B38_233800 [Iris pallida]|uniref:Uncharacterized protein n=1 Tax=Iris pallida TaxID=29817 RepID=A0AAX6DQL6_IRIPA|nr:hypothetical protein M6B38_233800 [Iris pallida]
MFSYRTRHTHDYLVHCSLLASHCLLRGLGEILAFV